jgi:hypothetical protein
VAKRMQMRLLFKNLNQKFFSGAQMKFFGVQPMDEKNFSTFLFTGLD